MPTSRATPRHLGDEAVELVDHRVDGVLQLEHLAADVGRDLLAQVAAGDRADDALHLDGGTHQVVDQAVDRFDALGPARGPRSGDDPLGELALLADHPAHPGQLDGQRLVGDDDVVEAVGDLAGQPGPFERHPGEKSPALTCVRTFNSAFASTVSATSTVEAGIGASRADRDVRGKGRSGAVTGTADPWHWREELRARPTRRVGQTVDRYGGKLSAIACSASAARSRRTGRPAEGSSTAAAGWHRAGRPGLPRASPPLVLNKSPAWSWSQAGPAF